MRKARAMQLYQGSTAEFVRDTVQQEIAKKLGDSFYDFFRYRASVSESTSWQNSLVQLCNQIQYARLDADNGIILEMQLPLTSSRLDCIITGRDASGRDRAVLTELKQWTHANSSEIDDCVESFVGTDERRVLHPSVQADRYATYLRDMNSAFASDGPVVLDACSWLHNMAPKDAAAIDAPRFRELLQRVPAFKAGGNDIYRDFLLERVGKSGGMEVLSRIGNGAFAPSKGLMQHVASVIKGEPVFTLLDEQVVAFNTVMHAVEKAQRTKSDRGAVIVRGGPGTGKSVIAMNVMARCLERKIPVLHATGSKAFTQNLGKRLGTRSRALLKYFNNFGAADPGSIDVLLLDEAHRIRKTSNDRFTPKAKRSDLEQIEEILTAARVSVFFIDDHQTVRPNEIGSVATIRSAAQRAGAKVYDVALRSQFRCGGSERYVEWVDQLLEVRKTGTIALGDEGFDFRIVDSPAELERLIVARAAEGASARMTAGFCWKWSDPNGDGTLVNDVRIGDFERPWNAKNEARRLADGIPQASFWATDPNGIGQIGCVYTAQGFEFDYCGVIFGRDLRRQTDGWHADASQNADSVVKRQPPAGFLECVRNVYRVLLTRGMKGCYVYFEDEATRAFVESRLK